VTSSASSTGRERIPLSVLTAYGSGGIIPIALFNVAGILVGLMGNISLGLSAFWLGVILVVPRISDALADPLIGHFSDNARTRWGRRRPFVLVGGLLSAVFFVLMWWIPKGEAIRALFPSETGYQWFQLGYILVSLTLFFTSVTLFEIPHGALGMEMTPDPHQRTRLFSAKSFVGNLFAMSTPWLLVLANLEVFKGPRGNEVDGMRYVSLMVAALIVPLSFWWFLVLKEPGFSRASKQEASPFWPNMRRAVRNVNFVVLTLTVFTLSMGFNFVQLLGSYIPIYYVSGGDKATGAMLLGINGSVWAVTGLLAVFPLNWLSPRLGKRSTLVLAILLIVIGQLAKIVCYDPRHPSLMAIPTVPLSCGMLFFFTLGSSMVGDICDEDELHTGARSEGAFYAVFWWFIKTGTALANLISGTLIVLTLFDESQVTKVDQLTGNVRDIRTMVVEREAGDIAVGTEPGSAAAARELVELAQSEASEFVTYLEGAALTIAEQGDAARARRDVVVPALFAMKAVGAELAHARRRVSSLRPQSPPRLIDEMNRDIAALRMRAKLEMTRVRADELHAYFLTRASEQRESRDHYLSLADDEQALGALLARTSDALPPAQFEADLERVVGALGPMSRQAPFTLLTMRLIEIGLPLLACFGSLLFVFRYGLTEERSREIKAVLAERRERRTLAEPPVLHEGAPP
jgi:glycoside/pentoside/hexuronide:cation symporter, GPH family